MAEKITRREMLKRSLFGAGALGAEAFVPRSNLDVFGALEKMYLDSLPKKKVEQVANTVVKVEKSLDHDVFIDWQTGEMLGGEQACVSSPQEIYTLLQDTNFRSFLKLNIAAGQTDPAQYPDAQVVDPARASYIIKPDGYDGPYDYKKKFYMGGNNCGPAEVTSAAQLMAYLTQSRFPANLNVESVFDILFKKGLVGQAGMMYCDDWYDAHKIIFDHFGIPAMTLDSPSHYPSQTSPLPYIPNKTSFTDYDGFYKAWFKTKDMLVDMTNTADKFHRENGAIAPMAVSIRPDKNAHWFNHFILSMRSFNVAGTPHFDPLDPRNYYQWEDPNKLSKENKALRMEQMSGWMPGVVDMGQLGYYSLVSDKLQQTLGDDPKNAITMYGLDAIFMVMPDVNQKINWKQKQS